MNLRGIHLFFQWEQSGSKLFGYTTEVKQFAPEKLPGPKGDESSSSKHPFFEGRTVKLWVMYDYIWIWNFVVDFCFSVKFRSRQCNISKFQAFPFFLGVDLLEQTSTSFLPWIRQGGLACQSQWSRFTLRGTWHHVRSGTTPGYWLAWRGDGRRSCLLSCERNNWYCEDGWNPANSPGWGLVVEIGPWFTRVL